MTDPANAMHYRQLGEQLRPVLERWAQGQPVGEVLQLADAYRREQHWTDAVMLYAMADKSMAPIAAVKHNLALCLLATGDAGAALAHAEAALKLSPGLWQSEIVRVKALKSLKRVGEALLAVRVLLERDPANGDARLELADLLLHELGDARSAQVQATQLRAGPLADPRHAEDAALTSLMARLYDRDESGEELTREIVAFADAHLTLAPGGAHAREAGAPRVDRPGAIGPDSIRPDSIRPGASKPARLRIGLVSPLLCCSPVYFFCVGALKLLAQDFDLVFVHRGRKIDWATVELRAIARDWFELADVSAEALAVFLQAQAFDVLIDLGGWMDTAALRALSTRPAPRMYKWVGGQSATTGLKVFDGMLSDRWQTPRAQQSLYTEPLVLLRSGYVTYTAPGYLPAPAAPQADRTALGVISNPAKVSRAFLDALVQKLRAPQAQALAKPLALRFIDQRYRHARAKARVHAALAPLAQRVAIEFVTPADHPAYLAELTKLDAVLDTHPYSGGLTTVEALALGVPCLTRAGTLFSERHSHAHCRYAGMNIAHADFDQADLAALLKDPQSPRQSLISGQSKRVAHDALALELASLLQHA